MPIPGVTYILNLKFYNKFVYYMSSEYRLKKLRGSGGFIMANITDEQQSRGSLGGPELFLAPMGRLDSEKITKYYCNTCDTEYIQPPKIVYENPDEQVADNLILVERGQYVCNPCNSTLAEYREFKKPDPNAEAGMARGLKVEPEPQAQDVPTLDPEPQLDTEPQIEPQAQDAPTLRVESQGTATNISPIQGLLVYDDSAHKVGIVSEVGMSSSMSLALLVEKTDGTKHIIPWSQVRKVGEIIILNTSEAELASEPMVETLEPGMCPKCKTSNPFGAKFCESCGTTLAK